MLHLHTDTHITVQSVLSYNRGLMLHANRAVVLDGGCYELTYHSDVTEQHGALRVDAQSFLKVDFCQIELLLFVVNHPQTVPTQRGTHTHTHTQDRMLML